MLSGHWRSYAAIGGIVALLCAASYFAPWITRLVRGDVHGIAQGKDGAAQQGAADDPVARPQKVAPPPDYKPECNKREDADLCAQMRMAQSAEIQSTLNVLGVGLLAATLLATGAAAVFTGLTWRTMEGTGRRQLRAYVYVDEAKFEHFDDAANASVKIIIRNAGQTPAYKLTQISARVTIALDDNSSFPVIPDDGKAGTITVINPGGAFKVQMTLDYAEPQLAAIRNHQVNFYLFGVIKYVDVFRRNHTSNFRMRYDRGGGHHLAFCEDGNDAT